MQNIFPGVSSYTGSPFCLPPPRGLQPVLALLVRGAVEDSVFTDDGVTDEESEGAVGCGLPIGRCIRIRIQHRLLWRSVSSRGS